MQGQRTDLTMLPSSLPPPPLHSPGSAGPALTSAVVHLLGVAQHVAHVVRVDTAQTARRQADLECGRRTPVGGALGLACSPAHYWPRGTGHSAHSLVANLVHDRLHAEGSACLSATAAEVPRRATPLLLATAQQLLEVAFIRCTTTQPKHLCPLVCLLCCCAAQPSPSPTPNTFAPHSR